MNRTKRAISAVLSSNIKTVVTIVVGFVVTPVTLGYIGRENYGMWAIIGNLIGYMGMLDMGITGSSATLISREQHAETSQEISAIASNSIFLHALIGGAVLLVGLVLSLLLPDFFSIKPELSDMTVKAFIIATIGLSLSFPQKSLQAVLTGTQNIASTNWIGLAAYLLKTVLILVFLYGGMNLLALPLSSLIVNTVSLFFYFHITKKTFPELSITFSLVRKDRLRRVFSVSLWWFLGGIGSLFIYSTDNIVVGHYLGPAMVTVYALTYRLSEMARGQIFMLNSAIMPGIGDLVGRREYERLKSIFFTSMKTVLVLAVTLAVFISIYNGHIIKYWVGERYFGGKTLAVVFALSMLQLSIFHNSSIILTSYLSLRDLALIRMAEGILNLFLSLLFVNIWGLVGVAFGTLLAGFLTSFWYVPFRAFRLLGIRFSEFLGAVIIPSAKFFSVMLSAWLFFALSNKGSLTALTLHIAGFGMLSVYLAYFLVYSRDEKDLLLKRRMEAKLT